MLRVCQQLASTYLQRSFLLLVTAASYLLVHKILLKLCFAVSYCLRRCPTKTPRTYTPRYMSGGFAAVRGSVGVRTPPRGQDRVRSTGQCQFSTEIPAEFCPTMSYAGASTNGGGRRISHDFKNGGGLPRKGYTESPFRAYRPLLPLLGLFTSVCAPTSIPPTLHESDIMVIDNKNP